MMHTRKWFGAIGHEKYDPVVAGEPHVVSGQRDRRKLMEQSWTQPIVEPTPSNRQPEAQPAQPMQAGEEEK